MIDRSTRGPAQLRLAHGKASALDVELLRALSQALDEASASRALVLTGTGHIFSAGLDAAVMRVWTNPDTRDAVRRYVERPPGARA